MTQFVITYVVKAPHAIIESPHKIIESENLESLLLNEVINTVAAHESTDLEITQINISKLG